MKKKSIVGLLSVLLVFGALVSPVSAAKPDEKPTKEEVTEKIKEIIKQDENVELIDPSELPEGVPMLNFDSVEDFEAYVNEHRKNNEGKDDDHEKYNPAMAVKEPGEHINNGGKPSDFTTQSSSIGSITWYDNNWWELTIMRMTFNYSYYQAGGYNYFNGASNINSWSQNISPVNWNQTNKSYMIMDGNRTLQLKIAGYHLFGAQIMGFPLGFRAGDSYTRYFYRSQID
ncbi:hypothetical protein AABM38_18365 [Heyndrickxia sp. MSNUG]|uniref:hypothetical protein n=1 Tax=Heyndrickxia sp. MSNUG TaxID=3136677 RepID=UPI003C2C070D